MELRLVSKPKQGAIVAKTSAEPLAAAEGVKGALSLSIERNPPWRVSELALTLKGKTKTYTLTMSREEVQAIWSAIVAQEYKVEREVA